MYMYQNLKIACYRKKRYPSFAIQKSGNLILLPRESYVQNAIVINIIQEFKIKTLIAVDFFNFRFFEIPYNEF